MFAAVKLANEETLNRRLEELAKRPDLINFAINDAMVETTHALHSHMQTAIKTHFDRPTPFVTKGVRKRFPAGKPRPGFMAPDENKAGIYMEFFGRGAISPESVLKPHVFGGPRSRKAHERLLASSPQVAKLAAGGYYAIMANGYPRDRYGNISGARMSTMLSKMGLVETAKASDRGGKRRKQASTVTYYAMRKGRGTLIMERRGKRSKPMIYMTGKTPRYKKTFNFFEIGSDYGARYFRLAFAEQFAKKLNRV